MRFTQEEFHMMVQQLLYWDPVSFDALCQIAEKTLRPSVIRWCKAEECLCGRGFEEDIMQEIHIRLIKTTVDSFLLRDGIYGPYNDDPEGFEDWMFRVAENLTRDFADKIRRRDFKTEPIDAIEGVVPPGNSSDETWERVNRLRETFDIVLSADIGIYKVLTWLAQSVWILDRNITKIRSNELILEAFADKTLYEMYDGIRTVAGSIPWMVITPNQHNRILAALQRKWRADVTYGEAIYRDFFMKQNGVVSGKKSISDWMNRINNRIRQKLQEASGTRSDTRPDPRAEDEKRKCEDGPSDSE